MFRNQLVIFCGVLGWALWSAPTMHAQALNERWIFAFINPLPLIDMYDGYSYRGGVEVKPHQRFAFGIEAGGYFHNKLGRFDGGYKTDITGYQVRPFVKYYLRAKEEGTTYIQAEYMYKQQGYTYEDSISIGSDPVFDKKYHMSRYLNCFSIKFGMLWDDGGRFAIEGFFGGGIRDNRSRNNLTQAENDGILSGDFHGEVAGGLQRWTGHMVQPNLTFGLKLGYIRTKVKKPQQARYSEPELYIPPSQQQ